MSDRKKLLKTRREGSLQEALGSGPARQRDSSEQDVCGPRCRRSVLPEEPQRAGEDCRGWSDGEGEGEPRAAGEVGAVSLGRCVGSISPASLCRGFEKLRRSLASVNVTPFLHSCVLQAFLWVPSEENVCWSHLAEHGEGFSGPPGRATGPTLPPGGPLLLRPGKSGPAPEWGRTTAIQRHK